MSKTKNAPVPANGTVVYSRKWNTLYKSILVRETPKFWIDSADNRYRKQPRMYGEDYILEGYGNEDARFESKELIEEYNQQEQKREAAHQNYSINSAFRDKLKLTKWPEFTVDGILYSPIRRNDPQVRVENNYALIEYSGKIINPNNIEERIYSEEHPVVKIAIFFDFKTYELEVPNNHAMKAWSGITSDTAIAQLQHTIDVMKHIRGLIVTLQGIVYNEKNSNQTVEA
jgi:hypothetical protein